MGDPRNVEIRLHFNKELESQLVTICKSCEVQTGTGTGVGSTVSAVDDKRPHFILVRCICKEASSVNAITEKFASTSQVLSVALSAFEIEVLPDCRLRLFIRPAPSRELLDLHAKLCLQIQDRGCEILKDFRKGYWQPRCRISEGFEPYLLMTISHKLLDKISVPLAGSVVELGLCEAEIDSEQSNSTSYRIQRVFPIQHTKFQVQIEFDQSLSEEITEISRWFDVFKVRFKKNEVPNIVLLRSYSQDKLALTEAVGSFEMRALPWTQVSMCLVSIDTRFNGRRSLHLHPNSSKLLRDLHNKVYSRMVTNELKVFDDFRPCIWLPRCVVAEDFLDCDLCVVVRDIQPKITLPLAGMAQRINLLEFKDESWKSVKFVDLKGIYIDALLSKSPKACGPVSIGIQVVAFFSEALEAQLNSIRDKCTRLDITIKNKDRPVLSLLSAKIWPSSLIPVLGKLSHTLHSEPFDLACEIIKQWSDSDRYSLCVRLLSPAVRNFQTRLLDILNLEGIKGISSEDFKCIAGKQYPCLTMATFEFWDYKKVKEEIVEKVQLCGNLQNLMIRRLWRGTDSKIHYTDFMSFPFQEIRAA